MLAGLDRFHEALPPDTLERGFSFADLAALNHALEEMYGLQGGRGMARRIGRVWLAQSLSRFGALNGLRDPAFRALTPQARVELGLLAVAGIFNHFSDQTCAVTTAGDSYHVALDPSVFAWGRRAEKPVCAPMVGLLQETTCLASGGHEYGVREIRCQAAGADACVFTIPTRPFA